MKLLEASSGTVVMEINLGSEVTALAVSSTMDVPCIACGTNESVELQCKGDKKLFDGKRN